MSRKEDSVRKTEGTKTCRGCGLEFPIAQIAINPTSGYSTGRCAPCYKIQHQQGHKRDADRARARREAQQALKPTPGQPRDNRTMGELLRLFPVRHDLNGLNKTNEINQKRNKDARYL
jgi:hypothetical protein